MPDFRTSQQRTALLRPGGSSASCSRRQFLRTAGATAVATATASGTLPAIIASGESRRRNLVVILIDDLRFDAMGCRNSFFETPRIDRMVREGVLFENAFVTTSLCSPSRASMLTGLYAHRHGVLDNTTPLAPGIPTFPEVLREAGYRTAFIGKWHMGGDQDDPRPGFDHWISFRGQGVYNNPTLNVNGRRESRKGYITDILTDEALHFLKDQRDQPFFLWLSHKAVHDEFIPAPRHAGRYADRTYPRPATMADTEENYAGKPDWVRRQRHSWHGVDGMYNNRETFDSFTRRYAETLLAVDESVGRVLDLLRVQGLAESTTVILTSDNGFQFGEHGLIDKRTMYEASIRIPLIAWGPGYIPAGASRSEMILNIDLCPTCCELAGANPPPGAQGRSFAPILRGETVPWRDAWLYAYFWERSFPQTPTVLGIRTDRYKFMRYHGVWDRYELYDLAADPEERNNLLGPFLQRHEAGTLDQIIRRGAEGETAERFRELSARLDSLLEEYGLAPEPNWLPISK